MPRRSLTGKSRHAVLIGLVALCAALPGLAQERWFQIEVSVFSNESLGDRLEETWQADRVQLAYPQRLIRLDSLLQQLMLPEFRPPAIDTAAVEETSPEPTEALPPSGGTIEMEDQPTPFVDIGPFPPQRGTPWRLPDPDRDPFLQLSPEDSEFRQTNRALERDPGYRLLFHGLWRQPMPDPGEPIHLLVAGGLPYGGHRELEGSLGFYFNDGRTRIVADANLWLSEFTVSPDEEQAWRLPDPPEALQAESVGVTDAEPRYFPVRIYHLQQQREMRSNEFHYLDHPALGLVVTATPYEVPPYPEPDEVP